MGEYIWTHILYDHKLMPKEINVFCPKCGEKAFAFREIEKNKDTIFRDESLEGDWTVKCTKCPSIFYVNKYDDLPNKYYKFEFHSSNFWAWNKDHLIYLYNYFQGREDENNPYHIFVNYLRKEWIKGNRKKELVNKIYKIFLKK